MMRAIAFMKEVRFATSRVGTQATYVIEILRHRTRRQQFSGTKFDRGV